MSRETPKTTPPLPTVPVGTRVIHKDPDHQPGAVVTVRRRKFAKRYVVEFDSGEVWPLKREDFTIA